MSGLLVAERLVMMDLEAVSDLEAVEILANKLLEEGIVKPSYIPAVKQREVEFCTGLQFEDMGIAIPHTDAEHVNVGAIGIAILKNPVIFKSMGTADTPVSVEMIFMIAILEPHKQVELLQALMAVFQEGGRLKSLKACKTTKEAADRFKAYLAEPVL
jgi:PTS system galactitol-specific IIA component